MAALQRKGCHGRRSGHRQHRIASPAWLACGWLRCTTASVAA